MDSSKSVNLAYINSPSLGRVSFRKMLDSLKAYMIEDQKRTYTIVIGTDSQRYLRTDYVTAIVVHRVGAGGRYFWIRTQEVTPPSLRQRIYQEALKSLEVAQVMTRSIYEMMKEEPKSRFNIEIHVDIGENGPTKELIDSIVGMIKGFDFIPVIKPYAFGASVVADRNT